MPTNEILPFATGIGANVMPQADYLALGGRTAGFTSGTALSERLNKVWRQSSFVSAMIAEFTMDYSGQSVLDDGDIDTFEANFVAALGKWNLPYGVAGGTASAITVSLSPVPTTWAQLRLFLVKITANNTGVTTINPNGLGARTIKKNDGTSDLDGDMLIAGGVGIFYNDGTNVQFFGMIGTLANDVYLPYGVAGGTANALTVTLAPVPTGLTWGKLRLFLVKITADNTASATINPNGLGARTFKKNDATSNLAASDLRAGGVALCLNDGTNVQLLGMIGGAQTNTTIIDIVVGKAFDIQTVVYDVAGSGNWTVPANIAGGIARFRLWGGGGAGGGAQGNGQGAAGGNGADYVEGHLTGLVSGASVPYVVGAGGAGVPFNTGGTGGSTSINGGPTARGGNGGLYGSIAGVGNVGTDNSASTLTGGGERFLKGARGCQGIGPANTASAIGGNGGSSPMGGGPGPGATGVGYVACSPGGGGGGSGGLSALDTTGGPGAPGRIEILYVLNV